MSTLATTDTTPTRHGRGPWLAGSALLAGLALAAAQPGRAQADGPRPLPERLSDTGLYADPDARRVGPENLSYSPQYPLWTDGAAKRRFIHVPPGAFIDASNPDAWVFPVGTKLWKEFSFAGRPAETRYIELGPDGGWLYAAYVWNEAGTDALLAPERGLRGVAEIRPGVRHDVPGRTDCLACHEGRPTPVLGFGALQLSPDRDPLAPHAEPPGELDLRVLVERGLVRGLPARLLARPPRVAAATPAGRAALGYLHGNCAMCHNASGPLSDLGLDLEQRVAAPSAELQAALPQPTRLFHVPGVAAGQSLRLAPGSPEHSAIVVRLGSRSPSAQMPPLGTRIVDDEAVGLVSRWISGEPGRGEPELARLSSKEERP
jgi:hypothetical protein